MPEFSPNHSSPITTDLRTTKPELAHAKVLADVTPGKNGQIRYVPVPEHELHELQQNEEIKLLAINFQRTEMTAAAALQLGNVFRQSMEKADALVSVAQKTAQVTAQAASAADLHEEKPRFWANWSPSGLSLAVVAGLISVVLGAIYWAGFIHGARPSAKIGQAQTGSRNLRNFSPGLASWSVALPEALDRAREQVYWVTSQPMETATWESLAAVKKQRSLKITVVAIGNSTSVLELATVARQYNLSALHSSVSSGRVNWLIVDGRELLDGAGALGVWFTIDPKDAGKVVELLGTVYLKDSAWAYREMAASR